MIVIVPYRSDRGHRDKLWQYLQTNYWSPMGVEIVVGEHTSGDFNRSKAINTAADRDWDLAVIADTDTWVPETQLRQAILTAKIMGRLVAAFNSVVELSQPCTDDLLSQRITLEGSFGATKVRTKDLETQSSMLVITRTLWDTVGGFDERFKGYGGEDNAFWKACSIHGGTPHRIPGNAYHLWHPPAPGRFHGLNYRRNFNLWKRYNAASTVEQLAAI